MTNYTKNLRNFIAAMLITGVSLIPGNIQAQEKTEKNLYFYINGKDIQSHVVYKKKKTLEDKVKKYDENKYNYSHREAVYVYKRFNKRTKADAEYYAKTLVEKGKLNKFKAKLLVRAIPFWAMMKFHATRLNDDIERNFRIASIESVFYQNNEYPPRIRKGATGEAGVYHLMPKDEKILASFYGKKDVFYKNSDFDEEKKIILSIYKLKECESESKKMDMGNLTLYNQWVRGMSRKIKKGKNNHIKNFKYSQNYIEMLPYLEKYINIFLKNSGFKDYANIDS